MCVLSPCAPPTLPLPHQERAELAAGRRHLEARQALYAELQTQLDNCPESVREQLQEQLRRVSLPSPRARARGPPARKSGARRGRTAGALQSPPAGRRGRRCGLEGTGTDWGSCEVSFLLLQALVPARGAKPSRRRGWGAGQVAPPGPRVQPAPRAPLPGPEWYFEPPPPNPLCPCRFKDAEDLETETKLFEDLEFQQLERESRAEEERELAGQGLLRGRAELLRSIAQRKVRPCPWLVRGATGAGAGAGAGDLGLSLSFLVVNRAADCGETSAQWCVRDSLADRSVLSKQQLLSLSPDPPIVRWTVSGQASAQRGALSRQGQEGRRWALERGLLPLQSSDGCAGTLPVPEIWALRSWKGHPLGSSLVPAPAQLSHKPWGLGVVSWRVPDLQVLRSLLTSARTGAGDRAGTWECEGGESGQEEAVGGNGEGGPDAVADT